MTWAADRITPAVRLPLTHSGPRAHSRPGNTVTRTVLPPLRKLLLELVGYGVVSGVALALDVSVLEALVKLAGWYYVPAATAAFVAGGGLAYCLSVKYVFRFRQLGSRPLELSYFIGLGAVGLIVNIAILSVAIAGLGLDLLPAKLLAACATFTTNFALRRQLLFVPARVAE